MNVSTGLGFLLLCLLLTTCSMADAVRHIRNDVAAMREMRENG